MSFKAAAWAIHQRTERASEKLILILLADCHNNNSGRCDPSHDYLAEHAMCDKRTAMRATESLERQGFLTILKKKGIRNKYSLKVGTDCHPCQIVTSDIKDQTSDIKDKSSDTSATRTSNKPISNLETTREFKFAEAMFKKILKESPKTKPPNFKNWSKDIRLAVDRDGRTIEELWKVFIWALRSDFWTANIRSPAKLRKQFDQLEAQRVRDDKKSPEKPDDSGRRPTEDL